MVWCLLLLDVMVILLMAVDFSLGVLLVVPEEVSIQILGVDAGGLSMGGHPVVRNVFNSSSHRALFSLRCALSSSRTRALSALSSLRCALSATLSSLCTCALSTLSASCSSLSAAHFSSCVKFSTSYCVILMMLLLLAVVTFLVVGSSSSSQSSKTIVPSYSVCRILLSILS